MEHDGCNGCLYEHYDLTSPECAGCKNNSVDKYKPMTNADRIRAMNDKELADFLLIVNSNYDVPCMIGENDCKYDQDTVDDCSVCFLAWLREEVKEHE